MATLVWAFLARFAGRSLIGGLLFAVGTIVACGQVAYAGGVLYRDAATGRWVKMAAEGDVVASGALAGRTFSNFSNTYMRPSLDVYVGGGACGATTVSLAAFTANVSGDDPDTGVFLYDAAAGILIDVAIEDAAAPIGGTWNSFGNPEVVIDTSAACTAHVIFTGVAISGGGNQDEGLFDATFSISGLTPLATAVLAEEGVSTPPPPFPAASKFREFPRNLGARQASAGTLTLAFAAGVSGGGVSSQDNTGVFVGVVGSGFSAVAREGTSCGVPGWAGAGPEYNEFPEDDLQVDVVGGGPAALYRAQSDDGDGATDTAIELSTGCYAAAVIAAEGGTTPIGGTYGNFDTETALAGSNVRLAFASYVEGLAGITKAIFHGVSGPPVGTVASQSNPDTAIGDVTALYTKGGVLAVNDGPGDVVFLAKVDGYAKSGLFLFNYGSVSPAELATFLGLNPSIDSQGNMVAKFD